MMTKLYLVREKIKRFIVEHQKFVSPVVKLVIGIVSMYLLSINLNYMSAVNEWWIILIISLICTVLPWTGISILINGYILLNFYAVSWEVMAVMAGIYIVMFCVYYMFQPRNSILLVIVPIFICLKLPLVPVVVLAVLTSVTNIIPVVFGTIIYSVVMLVKDNTSVLALSENTDAAQKFSFMISRVFENNEMWLLCAVSALVIAVICFVKRRKINYAREIAVLLGLILGMIVYLAGAIFLNVSVDMPLFVVDGIIALVAGIVTVFFDIALDYTRTEYVQFEDDDYYYYVKAVPKISIAEPEFTVKKFEHNEEKETEGVEAEAVETDKTAGPDSVNSSADIAE